MYAYLVQWLLKETRLDEKGVRDSQSPDWKVLTVSFNYEINNRLCSFVLEVSFVLGPLEIWQLQIKYWIILLQEIGSHIAFLVDNEAYDSAFPAIGSRL